MELVIAKELIDLIIKFQYLGFDHSSDGATLIGKAPKIGPQAWLNIKYPVLYDYEVIILENEMDMIIPKAYRDFLMTFSNGLNILSSTFSMYGLRRQNNRDISANVRQPYSILTPNVFERPEFAKDSYFFIGGYNWDGSHLYIDTETNHIHCCGRLNCESKFQWNCFEEMLLSEIKRIYLLFNNEGIEIDERDKTIPY